ncbi:hypothetical protein Sjap_002080 [Stephania japonica]|uniref:Protein kinase domain-containing protein n=1 Tax=Stephania japonica TaxID=461633 RepID=A0AAP0PTU7_9MAGN
MKQESLLNVQYNGKSQRMTILISGTSGQLSSTTDPVISVPLNLAQHLPQDVYVGFSASTGDLSEVNCVTSWSFTSSDIGESSKKLLWVWMTISVVVILSMLLAYFCHKHRKGAEAERIKQMIKQSNMPPHEFRLKELKSETRNFHPSNKLEEREFGKVYKGSIAEMGVAINRLSKDSHQVKQEFVAEITTISHLEHKNLVKLIGWCCENTALDYLHVGCNKKVLHRDVKASNVMLDSEFNAALGDFGLARNIQDAGKTHHSTKAVAGTPGYIAPEYVLTRKASAKTDIYGFGVMHIDLNEKQMERTVKLGLACCHPDPNQRPLISKVLQILSGETAPHILPTEKPAFVWPMTQDISESSFRDQCTSPMLRILPRDD